VDRRKNLKYQEEESHGMQQLEQVLRRECFQDHLIHTLRKSFNISVFVMINKPCQIIPTPSQKEAMPEIKFHLKNEIKNFTGPGAIPKTRGILNKELFTV
jgi:hypothetical protein